MRKGITAWGLRGLESYLGFGTGGIGRVKWGFMGRLTAMVGEGHLSHGPDVGFLTAQWAMSSAMSTESLGKAVLHKG